MSTQLKTNKKLGFERLEAREVPATAVLTDGSLIITGTDSAETIERRLSEAAADMSHYQEFDFVVVNDRFEKAVQDLLAILDGSGHGLRSHRTELDRLIPTTSGIAIFECLPV